MKVIRWICGVNTVTAMDKMAHLIVISARRHGRHNLSYLTYIVLKVPFNSNQPTAINCPTRYGIGT